MDVPLKNQPGQAANMHSFNLSIKFENTLNHDQK